MRHHYRVECESPEGYPGSDHNTGARRTALRSTCLPAFVNGTRFVGRGILRCSRKRCLQPAVIGVAAVAMRMDSKFDPTDPMEATPFRWWLCIPSLLSSMPRSYRTLKVSYRSTGSFGSVGNPGLGLPRRRVGRSCSARVLPFRHPMLGSVEAELWHSPVDVAFLE